MNFFEAQERSLRVTRRLIVLMTLAVIVVVAAVSTVIFTTAWLSADTANYANPFLWALDHPQLVIWILAGTAGFIGFASLYRITSLRQGGGRVARDLGGVQIMPGDPDPLRRQLHNVIEEMAIASGVPVPEVYLLGHEAGINAFAAGFGPDDAAIAATRGAVENLSREELQGVIAHEFSHILNGDMRLNIRLMGPLYGILAIGLLGRLLLRGSHRSSRSKRSGGGAAAAVLALGVGLTVTGYVGLLAGRLIKAGVSRQREYLADASAVQFTRQTSGIAGALKKIGGLSERSGLRDSDAEEVSHMLFADGLSSFSAMLATHPPLLKRIQALEPNFNEVQFAKLHTDALSQHEADTPLSGFAPQAHSPVDLSPDSVVQSIGNPDDRHIAAAQDFRTTVPEAINRSLESADQVILLLSALILHPEAARRNQQLAMLRRHLGQARSEKLEALYKSLLAMPAPARLPLVELALPQLKALPVGRQEYLLDLMHQLANQDNHIDLAEYALLRTVSGYLQHASQPGTSRQWRGLKDRRMQSAALTLLAIYTRHGHADAQSAAHAFRAAAAVLELKSATLTIAVPDDWVGAADEAVIALQNCIPRDRQKLIRALVVAALHDGRLKRPESELLRAICALLECPIPPLLNAS